MVDGDRRWAIYYSIAARASIWRGVRFSLPLHIERNGIEPAANDVQDIVIPGVGRSVAATQDPDAIPAALAECLAQQHYSVGGGPGIASALGGAPRCRPPATHSAAVPDP